MKAKTPDLDTQARAILDWARRKLAMSLPEFLPAIYLLPLKEAEKEDHLWTDGEFLCYVTVQKTAEGMKLKKHPVPEEWTGDRDAAYTDRYHYYYPGEPEAMGFEAPKSAWGGKGGR